MGVRLRSCSIVGSCWTCRPRACNCPTASAASSAGCRAEYAPPTHPMIGRDRLDPAAEYWAAEHNGKCGYLLSFDEGADRYEVALDNKNR
eukprot:3821694-Pleurochrysis_carterae.AAC.4